MNYWSSLIAPSGTCQCGSGQYMLMDATVSSVRLGECYGTSYPKTPLYLFPSSGNRLVLWLDAMDPLGNGYPVTNNSQLSTWVDKSGRGYNVVSSGSARPTYLWVTDATSGATNVPRPVFRFDGIDDMMEGPNMSAISFTNGVTVIAVVKVPSTPILMGGIIEKRLIGLSDNSFSLVTSNLSSNFLFEGYQNITNGGLVNLGSFTVGKFTYVAAIFQSNTNVRGYIDAAASPTTAHTGQMTSNSALIRIGRRYNAIIPNGFFSGDIAEIMVFNTVLSDTQRGLIEDYLNAKWGIF